MTDGEDVAAADALDEGELLGVTLADGTPVCLLRLEGAVSALGNVCTHAEFAMSDGVLHHDGTLECIWHGARFDCRTGRAVRHPASEPLPVYAVHEAGGRIFVQSRITAPNQITP